uniref:Uncharacterized protein n=1 Tax=Cucumis melo TaxID=3656 RepID=A0A9I9EJ12_CUCME
MSFCSIIDMGLAFNAFSLICTCLQNKMWLLPAIFDNFSLLLAFGFLLLLEGFAPFAS